MSPTDQQISAENVKFQDIDTFLKKALDQIQSQGLTFDQAVHWFETDSKIGCPRCGMSFGPDVVGKAVVCRSGSATLGTHPAIIRLAQGHCPTEGCSGDHLLIIWSLPPGHAAVRKIRLAQEVPLFGSNGSILGYWIQKESANPDDFNFKHLFDLSADYKQLSNALKQGRRIINTTTNLGIGIVFEGGTFYMLADTAAPNEMLASDPQSIELMAIRNALLKRRIASLTDAIPLEEYMALRGSDPKLKEEAIQSLAENLAELLAINAALPQTLTNGTFRAAKNFLSIQNATPGSKDEIRSLLKRIPEVSNQID